jgi:hypothetical protein
MKSSHCTALGIKPSDDRLFKLDLLIDPPVPHSLLRTLKPRDKAADDTVG